MISNRNGLALALAMACLLASICSLTAVTLPVSGDFEAYAVNTYPVSDGWKTWLSGSTASISSTQAHDSLRSLKQLSYNYWPRCDYLPIDQVPDRLSYQISIYMDPVAGRNALVGLAYGDNSHAIFTNNFIVNSGNGITGSIQFQGASGDAPVAVGQFPIGQWVTIGADLDFVHLSGTLWLNDTVVCEDVAIQPKEFDDLQWGHVLPNRFAVTEPTWVGGRIGTLYLDDVALFETPNPVVEVTFEIVPGAIKLKNNGRFVNCFIELPVDYAPQDVDVTSLLLQGAVSAEVWPVAISDYDLDGVLELMVKFDRRQLNTLLSPGMQTLEVTGALVDGTEIAGSCVVVVTP
jgi:hypothetical protein